MCEACEAVHKGMAISDRERRPVSRAEVAAAMVAVVAEDPTRRDQTRGMLSDGSGSGCIQGAMLMKLDLIDRTRPLTGGADRVMAILGYGPLEIQNYQLFDALRAAQQANDSGLPWLVALEHFEAVLRGESPSQFHPFSTSSSTP